MEVVKEVVEETYKDLYVKALKEIEELKEIVKYNAEYIQRLEKELFENE